MTGHWVNIVNIETGKGAYSFPVPPEDADRLERRVSNEVTRWSPKFEVRVVPFGDDEPTEVHACTGVVERMN